MNTYITFNYIFFFLIYPLLFILYSTHFKVISVFYFYFYFDSFWIGKFFFQFMFVLMKTGGQAQSPLPDMVM